MNEEGRMKYSELAWIVMRQRKKEGVRGLGREWSRFRRHVATASFFESEVAVIESPEIREWLRVMADKDAEGCGPKRKISRATINRSLSLISAIFAEAVERGLRKDNPCLGVKPKRRVDQSATRVKWTFFTPEEEQAIATCEAIPEADRLAILFALYLGVRQGEQCTLSLDDLIVDGPSPRAIIRYGSRAPDGRLLAPKSGKIREVPLIPRAIDVSRRWLALLPTFCPENPHRLVFPTARGTFRTQGKPLGRHDTFKKYLATAGLTKTARWHDLRHGCASSLIAGWWGRQWPIQEVKVMLGHSSVQITERYAHLADTVLQDAAAATALPKVDDLPKVAPQVMKGANDGSDRKRVFARGAEMVRTYLDNPEARQRLASRLESAARGAAARALRVASRIAKEVTRAA